MCSQGRDPTKIWTDQTLITTAHIILTLHSPVFQHTVGTLGNPEEKTYRKHICWLPLKDIQLEASVIIYQSVEIIMLEQPPRSFEKILIKETSVDYCNVPTTCHLQI